MIANPTQQHIPRVHQLSDQKAARDVAFLRLVLVGMRLRKPQEDVPRHWPGDAGKETARLGQERNADTAFGAEPQEKGTRHHVSERHDPLKRVDRQTQLHLAVLLGDDRLPFPPEVHPLRLDVERIQEFLHMGLHQIFDLPSSLEFFLISSSSASR